MAGEQGKEAPLPLDLRIDLAEAFIELSWQRLPARRSGVIEEARWRTANAVALSTIDVMLEAMLRMYDQRALENAS